jgi:hypothetical protein
MNVTEFATVLILANLIRTPLLAVLDLNLLAIMTANIVVAAATVLAVSVSVLPSLTKPPTTVPLAILLFLLRKFLAQNPVAVTVVATPLQEHARVLLLLLEILTKPRAAIR